MVILNYLKLSLVIAIIMAFIMFKETNDEFYKKPYKYMVRGVYLSIFIIIISLIMRDTIQWLWVLSLIYLFSAFVSLILYLFFVIIYGIGLIGESVYENKDKIAKVGKDIVANTKNEVSNVINKKEYEVNIIEEEKLKVERTVDRKNSTVRDHIEYEKSRLIIVEEKTRNLFDRIFNKNK